MTTLAIQTPRVFAALLKREDVRYKVARGGRGSGKSWFFAEMLIEECMLEKTDAVCIREVQLSLAQSVKKLLESKIVQMGVGHLFDIQESQIKCPFGGIIIFKGMQNYNSDTIKSLEAFDIAWIEEAQTLSQRSLDLLRPTIRNPGSQIWATYNPEKADDPIDALFMGDNPPPRSIVVTANYFDNPWFPPELREEMEYDKKRDYDKYRHVWLGEYQTNSEARVFKNWTVEEFTAPLGVIRRQGADWGFSVDPSVLVSCYTIGKRLYIDYEAYMVGCEIDMLPDLFDRVPESRKWFITADSARPETISYMQKHGFPRINAAIKGAKSIEDGIEFLKSFDIIVHPRCENVIKELSKYSFKIDPKTQQVLPILEDKNNHCVVAGTMVKTARGDVPIEQVRVGDHVRTRAGYRAVLFADVTAVDRDVVDVVTTHGTVRCTPDHEIFTVVRGFVRADALRYTDEIVSTIEEVSPWQSQNSSYITAESIADTRMPNGSQIGCISAQTNTSPRGDEHQALTMLNVHAPYAEQCSWSTSISTKLLVRGRVLTVIAAGRADKVYDLTVEDQHEFFANGVLVSNCLDAVRYACEGVRRAQDTRKKERGRSSRPPLDDVVGY